MGLAIECLRLMAEGGDKMKDVANNLSSKLPHVNTETVTTNVVSWLLGTIGIAAVVMMIVSGVKMTTSAGDPNAVKKAKQTMIYSVVGLVVAVLAYVIVQFVVAKISGDNS